MIHATVLTVSPPFLALRRAPAVTSQYVDEAPRHP
jgi:hypothetical protein